MGERGGQQLLAITWYNIYMKKIVIDGNDGTGKTWLVSELKRHCIDAQDRGIPTQMTDDDSIQPNEDEFYIILDAPVETCRERLKKAGKDLNEKYHTVEDLTHYRKRYLEVAIKLGTQAIIMDGRLGYELVHLIQLLDCYYIMNKDFPIS